MPDTSSGGDAGFTVYTVLSAQLSAIEDRLTKRLEAIGEGQQSLIERVASVSGRLDAHEKRIADLESNEQFRGRTVYTNLILPIVVAVITAAITLSITAAVMAR